MSKVDHTIVRIFVHAQALQQSGRLRSTIYCTKRAVYIMNQDQTVLMKFPLGTRSPFHKPISFNASDYDSSDFYEEEGRVFFKKSVDDFTRTKSCKVPQFTPKQVRKMFDKYEQNREDSKRSVQLSKSFTGLLDVDLSHVEFSAKEGKLHIIQRNIYSGSVITITKNEGQLSGTKIEHDFKPVAIRTSDLLSLYLFSESVRFVFCKKYIWIEGGGSKTPFKAIVGQCMYDELGKDTD